MVILLSAKQGGGKSTLAKGLEKYFEERNQKCFMLKFASPLYKMHDAVIQLLAAHGYPVEKGAIDGPLLQVLGTEWGRNKDKDIWAKLGVSAAKATFEHCKAKVVIFDDCRFENEFTLIDQAFDKVLTIRLEADEYTRKLRAEKWRDKINHASETDLDNFAEQGYFDLRLDSSNLNAEEILQRVTNFIETIEG